VRIFGPAVHVRRDGRVYPGDTLVLLRSLDDAKASEKAFMCSIPTVFEQLRAGDSVWIDDGHIGCTMEGLANPNRIELHVAQARKRGSELRAGKALNFPGMRVPVVPLSDADREAWATVIDVMDVVVEVDPRRTARLHLDVQTCVDLLG
jgi:pyruvate kinase